METLLEGVIIRDVACTMGCPQCHELSARLYLCELQQCLPKANVKDRSALCL